MGRRTYTHTAVSYPCPSSAFEDMWPAHAAACAGPCTSPPWQSQGSSSCCLVCVFIPLDGVTPSLTPTGVHTGKQEGVALGGATAAPIETSQHLLASPVYSVPAPEEPFAFKAPQRSRATITRTRQCAHPTLPTVQQYNISCTDLLLKKNQRRQNRVTTLSACGLDQIHLGTDICSALFTASARNNAQTFFLVDVFCKSNEALCTLVGPSNRNFSSVLSGFTWRSCRCGSQHP